MRFSTPDNSRTIFTCSCGCDQFFELETMDNEYWIHVVAYPATLIGCLRWWWQHRKVWKADLQLTKDDLLKLREVIEKL